MKDAGNGSFVCPNDRQLQLRAKLNSGWSFHTGRTPARSASAAPSNRFGSAAAAATNAVTTAATNGNQSLRDEELERIKKVLERAQRIELIEQERVGKLIDRLDNMKKHATGNGSSKCVLCADGFGMLGASSVCCVDCHKSVCNKCSIETIYNQQVISLCKICSENRELWKKSGAWFFRALPTRSTLPSNVKPSSSAISSVTTKSDSISIDDDYSSSEERQSNNSQFNRRPSPSIAPPNDHYTTANSYPQNYDNTHSMIEKDRDESIDSFKTDEPSLKDFSIDEYIPKSQIRSSSQPPIASSSSSSPSPIPSLISNATSSPTTNTRPLTSLPLNASSSTEDCGLGILDFDIVWREALNILTVTLIRARSLRAADLNGLSDPYVKLHIVPGVAKATKLRSHTIRRTLNPDFDETLVYHGISSEDIKTKWLKFTVLDEDSVGADLLGEYRLKLSKVKPELKEIFSVYLQNKTELPLDEDKNERGKILISLLYSKMTSNFHVRILRGIQLLPMDFGQTSDPYCKLLLYPSTDTNSKWSFKTTVKKHTLQPDFNEEFVFPHIQLQELISKTLQIAVYDKDMGKKDDYIGGFELGQSSSGDELRHWLLMVKSPEKWIEMWHKLKPDQYNSS
ncbi:unnamed protein product [Rotaria socialis]|uniref:Rabphilin n=2 Tax=Rotaria socialis TaxID=392032 RepID=A0A821KAI0_9BILA|nr:unnamed protein product [Rotaria socialis]CAF3540818.1 unnamed protein product [Rotaria socialis]CAF3552101.1 unnamed protein product [Rotaria socialis]CAF3587508.1 unnamed protein product [Rotaria socialis]CAF3733484.1 unnamed protein product [Rotaria socialis]